MTASEVSAKVSLVSSAVEVNGEATATEALIASDAVLIRSQPPSIWPSESVLIREERGYTLRCLDAVLQHPCQGIWDQERT